MQDETAVRLTDAIIKQSTIQERTNVLLEHVGARMMLPPPAARLSTWQIVQIVGIAALVGSCAHEVLAWWLP